MARMMAEQQISVRIRKIIKGLLTCYLLNLGYPKTYPKHAWPDYFCRIGTFPTKYNSYHSICYMVPSFQKTASISSNLSSKLKERCSCPRFWDEESSIERFNNLLMIIELVSHRRTPKSGEKLLESKDFLYIKGTHQGFSTLIPHQNFPQMFLETCLFRKQPQKYCGLSVLF